MSACRFLLAASVCLLLAACTPRETIKQQGQPLQAGQQPPVAGSQSAGTNPIAASIPSPAAPSSAPGIVPEFRDDLPPIPMLDLTVPPTDLWQRIRNGFGMRDISS